MTARPELPSTLINNAIADHVGGASAPRIMHGILNALQKGGWLFVHASEVPDDGNRAAAARTPLAARANAAPDAAGPDVRRSSFDLS